ncbi:MAG: response regulator [Deltaproteobacteria bacterium]|nr:MAG: response regulator [Deltaproteobacteria bacterium]
MSKKVLIVDDEPHIRLLLEQTLDELEDHDVELLTATNGREALEMLSEEHPELVLLDVMMPFVNGFDVCKQMKADPRLADIFVMMLTAKGQEFDRAMGEEVGVDLYITKPFDPDEVLEKAAEVLGIEL